MALAAALLCIALAAAPSSRAEEPPALDPLINEALANSPEVRAMESRALASRYRVPQAASLPDPMFEFGYQNEGWDRYTYGEMPDAQWIYGVSQMFPFPGKLSLKEEMAARESEGAEAALAGVRLKVVERVTELYHDLLLAHTSIETLDEKSSFLSRVEEAALSRYSSGMGTSADALMAQTEKYMLIERQEMLRQRIEALEAMLNSALGRESFAPLGRPVQAEYTAYAPSIESLIETAHKNSPELKARRKMVEALKAGVDMAKREYYPDFTLNASLFERGGEFDDMWMLTGEINIPVFYGSKQRMAVHEAKASLAEAEAELEAARLMLSSAIRDNYSMVRASERLMALYREGLIPKTRQDFDLSLASYSNGRAEAMTVILRLKALIDYELLYREQIATAEKAKARIAALTGLEEGSAVGERNEK